MQGAAAATALVGPLGLLVGAKTSSTVTTQTETTKLTLKLYVSDLHTPCFQIPFIAGDGTAMGLAHGAYLREAFKEIDAWYGRFRVIITRSSKNSDTAVSARSHRACRSRPNSSATLVQRSTVWSLREGDVSPELRSPRSISCRFLRGKESNTHRHVTLAGCEWRST